MLLEGLGGCLTAFPLLHLYRKSFHVDMPEKCSFTSRKKEKKLEMEEEKYEENRAGTEREGKIGNWFHPATHQP